jgi:hypothetical protein
METNDDNKAAPSVDLPRLVRLSDTYWKPWFAELLNLAEHHGITTSDDADLWWDDFGAGKTPQESMDGFLASDEWAVFRNNSLPNSPKKATSFQGAVSSRFTGVDGCPIMERRTLERNGKVVFDIWD